MKNILLLVLLVAQPLFAKDFYDKIRIRDTTNASSVTNGALRVDGGVSVAGFSYFGQSVTVARSEGPSLSIQDLAGAIGVNAAPLLNFRDSTSTMATIGYDSSTSYDLTFVALSSVAGFNFKQGPSRVSFLSASQNGDWLMPFGLGIGTGTGNTTNMLNIRKDQNSVTRAILSNQNTGSSAYSKLTVASDGGDFDLIANSVAAGASTQLTSASGFTNGLEINQLGTNPVKIKTNGTTRVTVGGSSGEAQLEKPLILGQSTTPSNPSSGYNKIYPKSDDKLYALSSGGTETEILTTSSGLEPRQNWLYNSNFDWWQRGTIFTSAGNHADRWYGVRTGAGSPDCERQTGSSAGATYGFQCFNLDTNSGSGVGMRQVLPIQDGSMLHNRTVSFQVKVKAMSAVNQVTVALNYSTSESSVGFATNVISSATATVNSSGFTTVNLSNVAVGTSYTRGTGTLQVSIYTSAVSSGGLGDIGNGLIIEQPMLVLGSAPSEYKNRFASPDLELQALQAYYEKSYNITTNPGTVTTIGSTTWSGIGVAGQPFVTIPFKTAKHKFPTVTYYNCRTGSSGTSQAIWDINTGSTDYDATAATSPNAGSSNFKVTTNSGTAPNTSALCLQWAADAEIN